ncbi:helicase HerA-like domain-containing protein [Paracoccus tegillarcae]|uniref:ATP-binding protein n=1 Tax=Paracoccus tegillarcae TaxID=1529068 RepID=A0A2K9F347_9RHOB|nr:helicase HerA-like domain-containing protein [Paracoccus tegillarcae]AUH34792.1 ATP-binding protein [Paracoccus tegillarcae]
MADILDLTAGTAFVGGGGGDYAEAQNLLLKYTNRHGLIAGATGTGKTVTLQTLAETLSKAGVPVFLADVKGDLSGLAKSGSTEAKLHDAFQKRADQIGLTIDYQAFPVTFWDVWGKQGHPVRTTPAEMGPLLLSRLLDLTDVQEGVMNIAFRIADEQGLALADMKDLRAMLLWLGENSDQVALEYGNVSSASVGAIQRSLLVLENEGGDQLFGEPALELSDLLRQDASGKGMINILAADKLMNAPRLYSTFLLWLLSELFEQLPEVGDPDKPKAAFFFDEAHLLFDGAPKALTDKVEQVARLIRSKGVSVWFISQNPADIPEDVLGQLGNRVQHALRAFTAKDQKALRMAAQNYRPNPSFDTAEAITEVGTGEAVTSLLEAKGVPGVAQRTLIRPPFSHLGPISDAERQALMAASSMGTKYDTRVDRESAQEILAKRATEAANASAKAGASGNDDDLWQMDREYKKARRYNPDIQIKPASSSGRSRSRSSRSDSIAETFGKSLARQLGTKSGQAMVRGVLGSLFRGK